MVLAALNLPCFPEIITHIGHWNMVAVNRCNQMHHYFGKRVIKRQDVGRVTTVKVMREPFSTKPQLIALLLPCSSAPVHGLNWNLGSVCFRTAMGQQQKPNRVEGNGASINELCLKDYG